MERKMKEAPVRRGVLPGDQPEQTRGPERGAGVQRGEPCGENPGPPWGPPHRGAPGQAGTHLLPECELPGKCCEP